jgi:hypothetical protein
MLIGAEGGRHARQLAVGVNTALLLLPPKVAIPVGIAVRAVTRVLDRGIDLGLGR